MSCDNCIASREPFYVGHSKRFRGARNGYLPSVCDGCIYKDKPTQKVIIVEKETDLIPIYAQINDLKRKLSQPKTTTKGDKI